MLFIYLYEIESTEEFVMNDEDVTRWDEWNEDEHIGVRSVQG
jgi:hypothetical protein